MSRPKYICQPEIGEWIERTVSGLSGSVMVGDEAIPVRNAIEIAEHAAAMASDAAAIDSRVEQEMAAAARRALVSDEMRASAVTIASALVGDEEIALESLASLAVDIVADIYRRVEDKCIARERRSMPF